MCANPQRFEQPGGSLKPSVPLRLLLAVSVIAGLVACAAPRSGGDLAGGPASSPVIDAVLPAGETWQVFRQGGRLFARVPARAEAWPAGSPRAEVWFNIAPPSGPYRPVQVLPAARGHFHVLDAASARLVLHDSTGGLISTFPLPARFTPFPAGRMAVFRAGSDAFTFIDYSAGEAWQYAERRGSEGAGEWVMRGQAKLPLGVRDCMQPPGTHELACVLGRERASGGSGVAPVRFDAALNRLPLDPESAAAGQPLPTRPPSRLRWERDPGAWVIEGLAADAQVGTDAPLFRHLPARRALEVFPGPETP